MKITKDTVVTMRVKVADRLGRLLENNKEPSAYLHGGYGNALPRIEQALEGQEPGHAVTLDLGPDEAFGPRDESLAIQIPKAQFPPGVKVGGVLELAGPDGHPRPFRVVKIKGPVVLLDGNHELAGQSLRFSLQVVDVRAASPEEIAHGHAHGAHGHHH